MLKNKRPRPPDGAASLSMLVRAAGLPHFNQHRAVGGDGDGVAVGEPPLVFALPEVPDGLGAGDAGC